MALTWYYKKSLRNSKHYISTIINMTTSKQCIVQLLCYLRDGELSIAIHHRDVRKAGWDTEELVYSVVDVPKWCLFFSPETARDVDIGAHSSYSCLCLGLLGTAHLQQTCTHLGLAITAFYRPHWIPAHICTYK